MAVVLLLVKLEERLVDWHRYQTIYVDRLTLISYGVLYGHH